MSDPRIYPLTFTPVLRDYLWGGRRLATLYGHDLPPGAVAESWEISGHPHGSTAADHGFWEDQSLPAILDALGEALVGSRGLGVGTPEVPAARETAGRSAGPLVAGSSRR